MNKQIRRKNDEYDEDNGSEMGIPVYTVSSVAHQHKIYIDELITNASRYRNVLFTLDNAGSNDVVGFHLNTPGGNVDTTLQICNAIGNTEAHTVSICHGTVASCGTIIALACAETIVLPNTTWMVHPISWGLKGDTKTVRNAVEFNTKQIFRLCHEMYFGFLTEAEINDMIENSRELWMDDNEVRERLEMRNTIIAQAIQDLETEQNEELIVESSTKKRVAKKKAV